MLAAVGTPIEHCQNKNFYYIYIYNIYTHTHTNTRSLTKSSRTHRGKSATHLIAEYHHGHLQSTPLGKLCIDDSA